MLIHCKGCGKPYRVDEKRLTPEGVRVKCRHCGAVLMIRLRREHEMPLEEKEIKASVPSEPEIQAEAPAAVPVAAFERAVPSGLSEPSEPAPSGYRFCIHCGGRFDHNLHAGRFPVCGTCEARGATAVSEPAAAVQGLVPGMPIWKKILLFILLVLVILFAAFMGYRMALGSNLMLTSVSDLLHGAISVPQIPPILSGAIGS